MDKITSPESADNIAMNFHDRAAFSLLCVPEKGAAGPVRTQYKVGRVLGSCKTPEQMEVARRFQKLAQFPSRNGDPDLMERAYHFGFVHVHVLPPKPLPTSEADRQRNAAFPMPAAGGRTIMVSKEVSHDFSGDDIRGDDAYPDQSHVSERLGKQIKP